MNYLQDNKRARYRKAAPLVIGAGIIFYIFSGLLFTAGYEILSLLAIPMWSLEGRLVGNLSAVVAGFKSNIALYEENKILHEELDKMMVKMDTVLLLEEENRALKAELGRHISDSETTILASVLSGPNLPPYETLVIDAGREHGVSAGDRIMHEPNIILGEVIQVFSRSSKVKLYSASGQQTDILLQSKESIHSIASGRGGGSFFLDLPNTTPVSKGMKLLIPGSDLYILGVVEYVEEEPVTASQWVLARYPLNLKNIRFVHIIKKRVNDILE